MVHLAVFLAGALAGATVAFLMAGAFTPLGGIPMFVVLQLATVIVFMMAYRQRSISRPPSL
jgi:multisubunit Na+/H+ antiporter MnhB subunit